MSASTISAPSKMDKPTLTQVSTDVIITWTEPTTNGRSINDYEILISNGANFVEYENKCNGTDQLVSKTCTIEMPFF